MVFAAACIPLADSGLKNKPRVAAERGCDFFLFRMSQFATNATHPLFSNCRAAHRLHAPPKHLQRNAQIFLCRFSFACHIAAKPS
jgi:hypothetical protein